MYRGQLADLSAAQATVREEITQLSTRMTAQERRWVPIERRMEALDIDLVPPKLLGQEQLKRMVTRHVEQVDELTSTEQELLDKEWTAARSIANLYETIKLSYAERKVTRANSRQEAGRDASPSGSVKQ